jgi:hypothetical protein
MPKPQPPVRDPALTILTAEPGLSLAAKGLACYLLTRPPRPVTYAELFRSSSDGMPFVRAAVAELLAVGLIVTVPGRSRGRPRDTGGIMLATPDAQAS